MKHLCYLLLLIVFGCESPIKFEEPQPSDSPNLSVFPDAYLGNYLCTQDSSVLTVSEQHIYEEIALLIIDEVDGHGADSLLTIKEELTPNGIEKSYFLEGEPLPLEGVIYDGAILVARLIHRDTLFSIGQDQVLRSLRGHLVLNFLRDDEDWDVVLLSQEINGDVQLSMTKYPDDLEALKTITPVTETMTENGEEQLILAPSNKAFRELVKKRMIFEECAYYERLPEYQWLETLF